MRAVAAGQAPIEVSPRALQVGRRFFRQHRRKASAFAALVLLRRALVSLSCELGED